jgi:hypothetical protein
MLEALETWRHRVRPLDVVRYGTVDGLESGRTGVKIVRSPNRRKSGTPKLD